MISHARVRFLVDYFPETGELIWRVNRGAGVKAGDIAGRGKRGKGYLGLKLDGQSYASHRIAWLWMTGEWPAAHIDHIDRNRANNCWANLRQATNAQNSANSGARRNSKSGIRGVVFDRRHQKWAASIKVSGRSLWLGYFGSPEEAGAAYRKKAREVFGEFSDPSGAQPPPMPGTRASGIRKRLDGRVERW